MARSPWQGILKLLELLLSYGGNEFFSISIHVKKIVEHRQVKSRPTVLMDDFKLVASKEKKNTCSLVRLILADGPLSEKEIGYQIFKLAAFTSFLAFISIIIQYHFLS